MKVGALKLEPVKRTDVVNAHGSKRICLGCARWEPTHASPDCSHPEIAILDVDDRDLSVLSGLAKAAVRHDRQRSIALGTLKSFVQDFKVQGTARVQATQISAGNVRSLPVRRVG